MLCRVTDTDDQDTMLDKQEQATLQQYKHEYMSDEDADNAWYEYIIQEQEWNMRFNDG